MFAIIKSGGKQYRVQPKQIIAVEKLPGEEGAQVALRDILMLGSGGAKGVTVAGKPVIPDACVHAEIVKQDRLPKVRVFKKKRRKKHHRTFGHRQQMTWLRIDGIEAPEDIFSKLSTEKSVKKVASKTTAKVATETAAKTTPKAVAETKTSVTEQKPDNLTELPGIGEVTEKNFVRRESNVMRKSSNPMTHFLPSLRKSLLSQNSSRTRISSR